jgi:hypothetical protein
MRGKIPIQWAWISNIFSLYYFIIISQLFNSLCSYAGLSSFLANINQNDVKWNVIFIVYLAFVNMFRFESERLNEYFRIRICITASTARSLTLYWRTACKSPGKSVPRNQIVPVLYADVLSTSTYEINSRFHRIHSLAALFQRSTLFSGRLPAQYSCFFSAGLPRTIISIEILDFYKVFFQY